ncbi:MAG TPA: hypothetical protein VGF61_10130 [Candidatus Acidoferrum sp.]
MIRIDLCLQVIPPFRGEIRLSSVRELLYQLRDLGMMFGIVTYDAWGSEESIQQLKTEGFSSEVLSVDKDSAPYETLKETIYHGRLECYEMPILARELATVIKDDKTGKIDHPPHSTKDCSDSAAGAVWNAEKTYVGAGTSQWSGVMTVNKEPRQKPKDAYSFSVLRYSPFERYKSDAWFSVSNCKSKRASRRSSWTSSRVTSSPGRSRSGSGQPTHSWISGSRHWPQHELWSLDRAGRFRCHSKF